jgi:trimethylamine---corrinoid protein Co-methyltransferase
MLLMEREVRVSRRPRRPSVAPPPTDRGLHHGPTAPYEPLGGELAQQLIDGALTLMQESGVAFETGSEALGLFRSAGCDVDADGVVRFAPDLVRDALGSVAKSARLWDRDGERFIELDCRHTWFMPGMTCIRVYDLASGEVRDSTAADLAAITRTADALSNIDAVCIACKNVGRSDIHGEIEEFAIMAANTTKPLEYLCEHAASLGVVIEMAAAIRGGRQALHDKPYFLQIVTPLPLNYHRAHTDQIIAAVRAGVPLSVGTLPIGGASTPITTAGSMVNSLATDFGAMVLAQLVRRGSFCIGSSDVCFMEPATGGIGNVAQTALADMVMCQVRRRLELPSFTGAAGYSSARRFGEDAVAELTASMMQAFYSRPATIDYLGSLDQGLTYSLHALLLCNDLAGLLRTLWSGVRIDAEMLALDLAREVGARGNYLAHRHTVTHCREQLWASRYFGPNLPLSTDVRPDRTLYQRIDDDLRLIIDRHAPAPLTAELDARLGAIRERFAATYTG